MSVRGVSMSIRVRVRVRVRLTCNYTNKGVRTYHSLRIRVRATVYISGHGSEGMSLAALLCSTCMVL